MHVDKNEKEMEEHLSEVIDFLSSVVFSGMVVCATAMM